MAYYRIPRCVICGALIPTGTRARRFCNDCRRTLYNQRYVERRRTSEESER